MKGRSIIHVDMDAFFAAVEQRDNPALRGLPLAVGGKAGERGVIATASYEARKFGVRSAIPTATALRLCPDLIVLPPDHKKYSRVSEKLMSLMHRYTPIIEPVSLDEAFMDVTGSIDLFGDPVEIGKRVQADIKSLLDLTASVGIGPNKFIAKLASDWKKPGGLTVIKDVEGFLSGLSVATLWGVGPQTVERLGKIGVLTVADLRELSHDYLAKQFGIAGDRLFQMARGIDERPVVPAGKAKSMGREITFPSDVGDMGVLLDTLLDMSDQICRLLRKQGLVCRGVTLKLKYPDFKTVTRSCTLGDHTGDGMKVYLAAGELLKGNWNDSPVRLIGLTCSRLEDKDALQCALFTDLAAEKQSKLYSVVDGLLDRYGEGTLVRGRQVRKGD